MTVQDILIIATEHTRTVWIPIGLIAFVGLWIIRLVMRAASRPAANRRIRQTQQQMDQHMRSAEELRRMGSQREDDDDGS